MCIKTTDTYRPIAELSTDMRQLFAAKRCAVKYAKTHTEHTSAKTATTNRLMTKETSKAIAEKDGNSTIALYTFCEMLIHI